MGQGKEVKTRPDPKVEIQEKGEIFFFYRPKVDRDEAHGPDDVQRLYIVLRPEDAAGRALEEKQAPDSGKEGRKRRRAEADGAGDGGAKGGHGEEEVNVAEKPLLRLVVMGRKSLPDPAKRSRPYWGYVELVTTDLDDVKDALKEEEYSTATRGKRKRPAARALGEGVYRMVKHEAAAGSGGGGGRRAHTHLVYKLELPPRGAGEPQEAMNVEPEASFLVQVKNPDPPPSGGRRGGGGDGGGGFRGVQGKRRAAYPEHLRAAFGSRRFAAADPPDLLNYEGCELLLIAASDDVEEELGLELEGEAAEAQELGADAAAAAAGCSDLVKMFGEVADVKPLLSGSWD
ncbi:hypothetical protein ACP4OV_009675 [Aristida adscensionis]